MLVGAAFTMFRMRAKIAAGLSRAIKELSGGAAAAVQSRRTERYMASKTVFTLIGLIFVAMAGLYVSFAGAKAGLTAAIVMLVGGFFFWLVLGYVVRMSGSHENLVARIS